MSSTVYINRKRPDKAVVWRLRSGGSLKYYVHQLKLPRQKLHEREKRKGEMKREIPR
jgi:hypothetical protein